MNKFEKLAEASENLMSISEGKRPAYSVKIHSINSRGLVQAMIDIENTAKAIVDARKELAKDRTDRILKNKIAKLKMDLEDEVDSYNHQLKSLAKARPVMFKDLVPDP